MKQIIAPIVSCQETIPGIYLMWLQCPELSGLFKPGQYIMVRCADDMVLRRPLSIHRVDGDKLALLFMVVGEGTKWLSHRQAGEKLDVLGPLGDDFPVSPKSKSLLLVAGGIGIAPLFFLAEEAVKSGKNVTVLFGAATKEKSNPVRFLTHGIKAVQATEDGSAGYKGLVTELIAEHAVTADQIFACGPMPMLKYMAENQKKLGIKDKPVHISLEMRMACGVGVCYGCTIRTKHGLKQVCKDGPVFALDDIIWDEMTRL
jgi:dihydroorotate dehydrogenase electron transfer subunit